MRRAWAIGGLLGASLWAGAALGAGSWVASAPRLTVPLAERSVASAALTPPGPALAQGAAIGRVSWRYQAPLGAALAAWLCQGSQCVALPGPRGQTEALAGLPAERPLHFRFALAKRGQPPVTLQGLQVIVNHGESR